MEIAMASFNALILNKALSLSALRGGIGLIATRTAVHMRYYHDPSPQF